MLEPAGTAEIRGSKVDATNMGDKRRMPSRKNQWRKGSWWSQVRPEVHRDICESLDAEKREEGGEKALGEITMADIVQVQCIKSSWNRMQSKKFSGP